MTPFDRHNIDHLSARSLNMYAEEPAYWTLVYLHQIKDEGGPRTWRGTAVEAGLDFWLYKRDLPQATQIALQKFEEFAQGELSAEIDKERALISDMLIGATALLHNRPEPTSRQMRVEYYFEGIEVPIIGYTDYEWEDEGIDLKTVSRMPTDMPPRHSRQLGLYEVARKKPFRGLYVTGKRSELKYVENAEEHVKRLESYAHSIRRLLDVSPDKESASRIFAPKFEHYFWNKEHADVATQIWG